MDEARQGNPDSPRIDQFEDEIELMDYLKVIWKWKYLILVGTLVCAVGAGVISFNMTKVYGIRTIVQPGIWKITDDGKILYIDSAKNIKALIDTSGFNGQVTHGIKTTGKEKVPETADFKVTIPKDSNALDILYETPDIDIGLQVVNNLNTALLERYGSMVEYHRENWNMEIVQRMSEIEDQKAALESTKKEIEIIEKTINGLQTERKLVKENTASLINQRDKFVSHGTDPTNALSSMLYTNIIQQNIELDKKYGDDLSGYSSRKEAQALRLETVQNKIKNLLSVIKSLEFRKNQIQNIQIIKPPAPSLGPIKPKIRLNVLLAAVVGLFLTVFLAFFVEYVSKYKGRQHATNAL
jgi:LPS O-antigen subunit length determinant protein (WzzB/FepE family)